MMVCVSQQWECRRNKLNKLRVYKCRPTATELNADDSSPSLARRRCSCGAEMQGDGVPMDALEIQRQLDFLQHHVNRRTPSYHIYTTTCIKIASDVCT